MLASSPFPTLQAKYPAAGLPTPEQRALFSFHKTVYIGQALDYLPQKDTVHSQSVGHTGYQPYAGPMNAHNGVCEKGTITVFFR